MAEPPKRCNRTCVDIVAKQFERLHVRVGSFARNVIGWSW